MDTPKIIKVIHQQYPDYVITSISHLGSGYDSDAYLINDSYVFKFPKHQIAAKNLYKEAYILLEISEQLPIQVPNMEFIGKSRKKNQVTFVGYKKIEGTELTPEIIRSLDEDTIQYLSKEIAGFFKVLHMINLETVIDGLEIDKKAKCLHEYEVIKEFAFPLVSDTIKNEITHTYECILDTHYEDIKCLVHNDFGASNILFDITTNRICGIIDFGDIAIYDRDIDFVSLLQTEDGFNQEIVAEVFKQYQHNDKNKVIKKFEFNAFYAQLENIVLGKEYGMDDLFEESINDLKQGLKEYEKHILLEKNYINYI